MIYDIHSRYASRWEHSSANAREALRVVDRDRRLRLRQISICDENMKCLRKSLSLSPPLSLSLSLYIYIYIYIYLFLFFLIANDRGNFTA